MDRPLTRWGLVYGVAVFVSGVVAISCGLLTWLEGDFWQSLLLALGGTSLAIWSSARLATSRAAD